MVVLLAPDSHVQGYRSLHASGYVIIAGQSKGTSTFESYHSRYKLLKGVRSIRVAGFRKYCSSKSSQLCSCHMQKTAMASDLEKEFCNANDTEAQEDGNQQESRPV